MWIQVRSMDGKKSMRVDGLSKLSTIEDLREKLVEEFNAPPDRQRLFYRGKQLVDGHTLFDYNVGLNEIIQIIVRPDIPEITAKDEGKSKSDDEKPKESQEIESQDSGFNDDDDGCLDGTYKVGDTIDCRDESMGAWFEAKIVKVERGKKAPTDVAVSTESAEKETNNNDKSGKEDDPPKDIDTAKDSKPMDTDTKPKIKLEHYGIEDDGYLYHTIYEGYEDDEAVKVPVKHIRPIAKEQIPFSKITVGQKVFVNYNYDETTERGYWYDAIVTEKKDTRSVKELYCTVFVGGDLVPMEKCLIQFRNEVFKVEPTGRPLEDKDRDGVVKRTNKPDCDHCLDNPKKKCKECACHVCGGKDAPEKTLMCDECDMAYHIYCLNPPLESIPEVDDWYCPECRNDASEVVQAGEKLKESKKKAKMASKLQGTSRDWGRGMACVGRTKMCSIVPTNHFGPVPGVEVGSLWKFRVQVSEAGCHRPHVAGIAGRAEEGCYSVVLAGGYEDDQDDGDEFTYTGSGGRDLSGNKRTAEQSCDQTLTRMNMAIARNCNVPLNKAGGDAGEKWQGGKPVRVIRNCKGRKHSKYAPEEGNRYDGIFKVVKYWPEKGKSGFLVWRYLFRRDDEIPPPWTKKGKKRIEELGLKIEYPDGYLEAQAAKEKEKEKEKETDSPSQGKGKGKGKGKRKRVVDSSDEENEEIEPKAKISKASEESDSSPRKKLAEYKLDEDIQKMIAQDTNNAKLWEDSQEYTKLGGQKYLAKVEELFLCICCQDIVFKPITTECRHNVCKSCLQRSFKAGVFVCPACRFDLGENYKMTPNTTLTTILNKLFPGYENGR